MMSNRKGLPQSVDRKLKTRGEIVQEQKCNSIATAYHDKQTVYLLSTNQVMGTAEDRRPLVIVDDNKNMSWVILLVGQGKNGGGTLCGTSSTLQFSMH